MRLSPTFLKAADFAADGLMRTFNFVTGNTALKKRGIDRGCDTVSLPAAILGFASFGPVIGLGILLGPAVAAIALAGTAV